MCLPYKDAPSPAATFVCASCEVLRTDPKVRSITRDRGAGPKRSPCRCFTSSFRCDCATARFVQFAGGLQQVAITDRCCSVRTLSGSCARSWSSRLAQESVAKMEAADPSVSADLLLRAVFALGATPRDVAAAIRKGRPDPVDDQLAQAEGPRARRRGGAGDGVGRSIGARTVQPAIGQRRLAAVSVY